MQSVRPTPKQEISFKGERARFRHARTQKFKDSFCSAINAIYTKVTYLAVKAGYKLWDFTISAFNAVVTDQYVQELKFDFAEKLSAVTSKNPNAMARTSEINIDTRRRVNNRAEFISILKKIKISLRDNSNSKLLSKIQQVTDFLSHPTEPDADLNVIENAYASSILEKVLAGLKNETTLKIEQLKVANENLDAYSFSSSDAKPADPVHDTDELIALKTNVTNASEELQHFLDRYQTITTQIEIAEHKARVGFDIIAREKRIDRLDTIYRPLFKTGYSRCTTFEGSAGASAGGNVGFARLETVLKAIGKIKQDYFVNDLGYLYILDSRHVGVSAEAKADLGATAESKLAGIKIGAKASAALHADATKINGEIYELKNSRDFCTYLLPELTRNIAHRHDPEIAPYLSRSSLLAHAMADSGLSQNIFLWATTREETESINISKKKSDLLSNHHDKLQSLFLTSISLDPDKDADQKEKLTSIQKQSIIEEIEQEIKELNQQSKTEEITIEIEKLNSILLKEKKALEQLKPENIVYRIKTDRKPVTTTPVSVSTVTAGRADVTGYEGNVEAKVGVEASTGSIDNAFSAAVTSKPYTYKERKARDVSYVPLCKRIADTTKPAEEKRKISQQIAAEFALFKDTLFTAWGKDTTQTKLTEFEIDSRKTDFSEKLKNKAYIATLKEKNLNELSKKEKEDELKLKEKNWANLVAKKWATKVIRTVDSDLTDEKVLFKLLKEDFEFYFALQVRVAQGVEMPQDKKLIASFQQRYGADSKEQLLHRMVIVNAWLFSTSTDEKLKACLLEFEHAETKSSLLSPGFDVDEHYMKEHAKFQYEMDFEIIEHHHSGAEYSLTLLSGLQSTFTHKVIDRERTHNDPFFDGHSVEYCFSVSGLIGNINQFIKSVTSWIEKDYPELANNVLADMTCALESFELVGSVLREKAFVLSYYKPNGFGGKIPMKGLYYRKSTQSELQAGFNPKLNGVYAGIPVSFNVGVTYTESTTDSEFEVFLPNTFINALRFGMTDYAIGSIDKESGEIAANSTWNRIKQEQEKFFRKVFSNYAVELEQGNKKGILSQEMCAFESDLIESQYLSPQDKTAFSTAFSAFKKAVQKFNKNKNPQNYAQALSCFEKYMHALYPHWNEKKSNAPYFRNGHVPKIELSIKETSQAYVESQRRAAKFRTLVEGHDDSHSLHYSPPIPFHETAISFFG